MANSDNTKLRILRLCQLLQRYTDESHTISRSELIRLLNNENLGAGRQTIANDIAALELSGLHISTDVHDRHIYYRLESRACSSAEMKLLIDLAGASSFITEKQSAELCEKILKFASIYEKPYLQRKYLVPGQFKTLNDEALKNLDIIHRAIREDKRLKFYQLDFNWRGRLEKDADSEEIVSPGYVIPAMNEYYLLAYSHLRNQIQEYRIDKMTDLKIVNIRRFRAGEEMNKRLIRYKKYMFAMDQGAVTGVTLECIKSRASLIYDRFGTSVLPFPSKDPERFHVTVEVAESEQFYGWVSSVGTDIRITGPADVRERYIMYLKKIINSYSRDNNMNF